MKTVSGSVSEVTDFRQSVSHSEAGKLKEGERVHSGWVQSQMETLTRIECHIVIVYIRLILILIASLLGPI